MADIKTWLKRHELERLAPSMERHGIELDILDQLTDEDMRGLGISLGDRYRLRKAISKQELPRSLELTKAHFRHLTVLFSDLVESTVLTEQLNPEEYRRVLLSYQETVAAVMMRYEGLVTRYDGDGVLVLFGYPKTHEDDPERAVRAALDSVSAVADLHGLKPIKLASRIGIATGEVVVDLIGEGPARQIAASGMTTHLAARLEGLAGPNTVVISDTTRRLVTTVLDAVPLPPTTVKGLSEPVRAYVVKGEHDSDRFEHHSARGLTPLIARDAECDQLRRTWRAVRDGEGMVTAILGEAGIGKSRLIKEFLAGVPSDQVARYFCLPRYQNSMLHPIVRQLRDAIRLERDQPASTLRDQLRRLPGLDEDTDDSVLSAYETLLSFPGEKEDSRVDREELFQAIIKHLSALISTGMTVLVVEDLHWADPTTLELLERIVAMVAQHPFLLLATARPDVIPAFMDLRAVSAIKLVPLTRSESLDLVDILSQGQPLSVGDKRRIAKRCDGVPLYLEEITRAALDKVDVSILEQRSTDIPETLRDIFMARLDRLGNGAELAQIASVLGRRFTVHQLEAVADLDKDEISTGLWALENAGVLTRRNLAGESGYQFNHALTADSAYASLLDEVKRQLHGKVARMLDADPTTAEREPETAAWHYEWAGEVQPAIRLRTLAGERASARSANVESAYHFNQAVKLTGQLPDDEGRPELELSLRLELGTQLIACHGSGAPAVEANFERSRVLCELVPDEHQRWQALYGLWSFNQVKGRLREAKMLGETLLELAQRLEGYGVSILAHRAHGLCLFAMGIFDRSREHLERAVEIYDPQRHGIDKSGDISDVLVLAKCNLGWLCCFQGERERALRLHQEAISQAEELEHQHSLAFALALSAASHQALNDMEGTQEVAHRLVRQSESNSYPYWLAWGQMLLAWACAETGNITAGDDFDAGLKAYNQTGARMMNAYFQTLRAELEVTQERYEDALARLSQAEQLVEETATQFYAAEIPRLQAVSYAGLAEPEKSQLALLKARSLANQQGNALLVNRIEATSAQLLGDG